MTTRAFLAGSCLALLAALAAPARAAAQEPSIFLVDSCALLPFCEGRPCPAGSHPVDIVTAADGTTGCFCAPGSAPTLGTPATCCRGTVCFPGSTCVDVADTGASLCRTPEMHCLGGDVGGSLAYDSVRACFVAPGTSTPQPYWGSGDCDGDGRPNGAEVSGGTDPCCDEVSDPAGCCLLGGDPALTCCALDPADPVGCCVEQDVEPVTCCALDEDPIGCCFEAGGEPATCCDGHDPAACCAAETDPRACCEAAGGTPEACCEVAADPLGCCLGTDAPDAACCAQYGTPASPACAGIDASNVDAGVGDGGNAGLDGGTTGGDTGNLGFGGGAGCRCAAGRPEAPSPLTLLGLLAIAIPAIRRRAR